MSNTRSSFEEELTEQGKLIYRNRGYSMMPMLRQNRDLVIIEPTNGRRCRRYDVVLYRRGERYILHRILKVTPNGYVICGDHNVRKEYDVTDDQIVGVLTAFVRNGKEISTEDRLYKAYVHLWCDCFPARVVILRGKAVLGRWKRILIN